MAPIPQHNQITGSQVAIYYGVGAAIWIIGIIWVNVSNPFHRAAPASQSTASDWDDLSQGTLPPKAAVVRKGSWRKHSRIWCRKPRSATKLAIMGVIPEHYSFDKSDLNATHIWIAGTPSCRKPVSRPTKRQRRTTAIEIWRNRRSERSERASPGEKECYLRTSETL